MAGIAGTLDLRAGLAPAAPLVRRMLLVLRHRGPDGEILVEDGPVTLGARVHAVLDGADPPSTAGPLRLVLDGDIVNCPEVAASLASARTLTRASQTETVLAAWAELGPDCLERFEGTFALALWDADARRLYCARDRLGLRPLYYTIAGGRVRFASEIRALLADDDVPRVPDDARVLSYLAHGIADETEQTFLCGVGRVPGAGCAILSPERGLEHVVRWHRHRPAPAHGPAGARVRELLEGAVEMRLRGHGVVGATLSGGLDSASVLATAAVLRKRGGATPPLAVVARTTDPRTDEWPYARLLLERYGIPSLEVWPGEHDIVDDFDTFVRALDEPCHAPSVYGHWRVMRAARSAGLDVVLEGQSGERFGGLGYWYPQLFYDMLRRGRLDAFVRELAGRRRVQGVPVAQSLLDLGKLLLPRGLRAAHAAVPTWVRAGDAVEPLPLPARGLLQQQLHEMTVVDLPLLSREVDRDATWFSLAPRSPFQDSRIVDYALSLTAETLHRGGWGKAPLRDAMRGLVPDEILDRPTKQGFTVDQAHWVRGAFGRQIERTFLSEAARSRPYWDAAAVLRLLDDCRAGRAPATEIWRAYSVERWLELVVDPAGLSLPLAA